MRDLVDARAPGPIGVPLTDGNQDQRRFRCLFIGSENRAPPTGGSRDVELHASTESGPVVAFLFTTQKPFARDAVAAHLFYDRFDRCLSCLRAARKVLREHLIDDANLEAQTRTRAHDC